MAISLVAMPRGIENHVARLGEVRVLTGYVALYTFLHAPLRGACLDIQAPGGMAAGLIAHTPLAHFTNHHCVLRHPIRGVEA